MNGSGRGGPPGSAGRRTPPKQQYRASLKNWQAQLKALDIISKIAAAFSLIGSGYIIYDIVWKHKKQRKLTRNRILLALSTVDFCSSLWVFIGSWATPDFYRFLQPAASGNTQTCTVQGFFLQMGMATPWYNASLALHFLLSMHYGHGGQRRRLESMAPLFWILPFIFGLGTAIAGLSLDVFNYNPFLGLCWIAAHPITCDESLNLKVTRNVQNKIPCKRGEDAHIYRWAFGYVPLWTAFAFMVVAFVLVFRCVRKHELKMRRWSTQWAVGSSPPESAVIQSSDGEERSVVSGNRPVIRRVSFGNAALTFGNLPSAPPESLVNQSGDGETRSVVSGNCPVTRRISFENVAITDGNLPLEATQIDEEVGNGLETGQMQQDKDVKSDIVSRKESEESTVEESDTFEEEKAVATAGLPEPTEDADNIDDAVQDETEPSASKLRRSRSRFLRRSESATSDSTSSAQPSRSRRVAVQSLCYVVAFFLTWTFPLISMINSEFSATKKYYWLDLLISILFPLQGFFNCLVYLRPRLINRRKRRGTNS